MNYFKEAFSQEAKIIQRDRGSRLNYELMESKIEVSAMSIREQAFISKRDSFYIASQGSNTYPYLQHKGGPSGFLKVLDATTLGYLEFRGNMQFITEGNLKHNNNVSLFLMDYPQRTRLKILGEADVMHPHDQQEVWQKLQLEGYKHQSVSAIIIHVKGYDWNCPQHITPRYTLEQIDRVLKEKDEQIKDLKAQIRKFQ